MPGVPTVCSRGPELPDATTKRAPVDADSSSTVSLSTSEGPVAVPPSDMETIFAPERAAHSMPAMIQDDWPRPALFSTLPTSSSAPGATPLRLPWEAAPEPAIVDATWVPCPWPSCTASSGTKLVDSAILPARSGCPASTPVSRTATLTPLPS